MNSLNPKEATIFIHKTAKDSKGEPQKFKRNGKTKTWERKPNEFEIPVKRGLREYGYITQDNIDNFTWV